MPSANSMSGASPQVVLGVSGGIAAYKAADLASTLVQSGFEVHVAMTESATRFVSPLTFQGITHQSVLTDVLAGWEHGETGHVQRAADAAAVVIAPATANTIARLAVGLVDDMLTAIALATEAPLVIAPAMEHHMWLHPATQANVSTLVARGAIVVGPAEGRLASGASGMGRLAPTAEIVDAVRAAITSRHNALQRDLAGKRVVVTAGGTREALDPVRYLGNRSSGLMGVEIARAAAEAGADVVLIATGSVDSGLVRRPGARVVRVESALELERAVHEEVQDADVLVMAAAVADFRPASVSSSKIKKQAGQETMTLELVRNPDILAGVQQPGLLKVGFAAETSDLLANAQGKLASKGLDMIVANDAVATIGSERSAATIIVRGGTPQAIPEGTKAEVAQEIVEQIVRLLGGGVSHD